MKNYYKVDLEDIFVIGDDISLCMEDSDDEYLLSKDLFPHTYSVLKYPSTRACVEDFLIRQPYPFDGIVLSVENNTLIIVGVVDGQVSPIASDRQDSLFWWTIVTRKTILVEHATMTSYLYVDDMVSNSLSVQAIPSLVEDIDGNWWISLQLSKKKRSVSIKGVWYGDDKRSAHDDLSRLREGVFPEIIDSFISVLDIMHEVLEDEGDTYISHLSIILEDQVVVYQVIFTDRYSREIVYSLRDASDFFALWMAGEYEVCIRSEAFDHMWKQQKASGDRHCDLGEPSDEKVLAITKKYFANGTLLERIAADPKSKERMLDVLHKTDKSYAYRILAFLRDAGHVPRRNNAKKGKRHY